MLQVLNKNSVVFVDEYNGKNCGILLSELKKVLKKVGVVPIICIFVKV